MQIDIYNMELRPISAIYVSNEVIPEIPVDMIKDYRGNNLVGVFGDVLQIPSRAHDMESFQIGD